MVDYEPKTGDTENKAHEEAELARELNKRLTEMQSYWSAQYTQIGDDLAFKCGSQWPEDIKKLRKKRPTIVLNETDTYIRRIVNSIRLNPFGINVTCEDQKASEFLKSVIKGIEYQSNAQHAYETAFDHAVTGGLGFIVVTTDYASDDDLEQVIKIVKVSNPRQVMIDPSAESHGDARFGIFYSTIDKEYAEEVHGEDIDKLVNGLDVYSGFDIPSGSIADILYFKLESERKPKYWMEDGSSSFEKPMIGTYKAMREVIKNSVCVYHFIGSKLIGETKLDIDQIPIIPVYGMTVYETPGIYYAGMVKDLRPAQQLINYYVSSEAELIASAPKNPWVIANSQIQGQEGKWAKSGSEPPAYLSYNAVAGIEKPSRENNSVQTASLIQAKAVIQGDFARITGMFDPQLGIDQNANQSGVALQIRGNNGDVASAQYTENYADSIAQVGKIIVKLIPVVYDSSRPISVVSEDGKVSKVYVDLSEIMKQITDVNVTVSSGPAYESKRKEGLNTLLQIGQMLPDQQKTALLDLIVDGGLEVPNKTAVVERLRKLLPPGLYVDPKAGGAIDPAAKQALDLASQTIQEQQTALEQATKVINQLQNAVMELQVDSKNNLLIEEMKSKTSIAVAMIKEQGSNERNQADIQAQAATDLAKLVAEGEDNNAKLVMQKSIHEDKLIVDAIKTAQQTQEKLMMGGM